MNRINYSKVREIVLLPGKPLSSLIQTPLAALPGPLKLDHSCKPNPKYNAQARVGAQAKHILGVALPSS